MLHTASDCAAGVNTNPVMPSGLPESEREGILPEPYEQTAVHKNSGSKQTAAPAQRPTIIQSLTKRTQAKVQDMLNRSQNVKVIARRIGISLSQNSASSTYGVPPAVMPAPLMLRCLE